MIASSNHPRRNAARILLMARLTWLLVALAALLLPRDARAEASEELKREAGEHFERGVELYQEGSLDAALVEFERAYELVPNYRLLYNLAQIQAERHEYPAAIQFFERYLAEGESEVSAERRGEVEEQLTKLRERVGQLWVESDVEGTNLFVNDEPAGTLPLAKPLFVAAGVYRIRVERPGYRPVVRKVKVAGGDQLRVEVPVAASPLLATATGDSEDSPEQQAETRNYRPAWIAGASALALGGATLTFGLLAAKSDRTLDDTLNRFPIENEDVAEQRKQVKTFAGMTDGFGAATAVALALTVYFLIDPPSARREVAASKRVRTFARPGGFGLQGQF